MGTYIARRLLLMIPTLIGITFLVFMIVALAPGGIGAALKVQGGNLQSQTSAAVLQAYLEDRYGLDDPVVVQYARWLGRISPVKFGQRDQILPSGEKIRPPRDVKEPPVWQWFADRLPEPASKEPAAEITDKVEAYRAADRAYADARQRYIQARTLMLQALGRYARAADLDHAVTSDGEGRPEILANTEPDRSNPEWPAIERQGREALNAYAAALGAKDRLQEAFDAKPYPEAGFAIIPSVVSVAMPDFGVAYSRQRPVIDLIGTALPITLLINLVAFPIIYMIAVPGGMLAATHRGSILDTGLGALFIALWSIPTVLAGVLAIGFLANREYLGAFPVSGLHDNAADTMRWLPSTTQAGFQRGFLLDTIWHMCLPVLCLVYTGFAVLSKQTRAAMLDNFNADYVRTAKAKGVAHRDVVLSHVFRNSLLPVITMFVTIFPAMLAGSVVVERIFTIPGMGSLVLEAINLRDRELLLANTLMIAGVNLLALLLADIMYALADPRVSYS